MTRESGILTDTLILSVRSLQMFPPWPPCWLQYLLQAGCQYYCVCGRLVSPFDFLVLHIRKQTWRWKGGAQILKLP